MPMFRRKPVVVEGWQFLSYRQVIERLDLPPWVAELADEGRLLAWQDHAEVWVSDEQNFCLCLELGWWLIRDPYRGFQAYSDLTGHFDPYEGA
jgi:hypothetical protein